MSPRKKRTINSGRRGNAERGGDGSDTGNVPLSGVKWWALRVFVPLVGAGGIVSLFQMTIGENRGNKPNDNINVVPTVSVEAPVSVNDVANSTVFTNIGDGPVTVTTNTIPTDSENRKHDIKDACRSELSLVASIDATAPEHLRGQLVDAAVNDTYTLNNLLSGASLKGNMNCVIAALKHGAQSNGIATLAEVSFGVTTAWTPLLFAINAGNEKIVDALIESGADPDLLTEKRPPPIVLAAEKSEEMALNLLRNVNNVDVQDENGQTALHIAAKSGYLELAKALIKKGADPFKKDSENNFTPIDIARSKKRNDIVSILENLP